MSETPEGDRIAKVLSRAGVASRREAERMIELGQVAVNGKVITSAALNVTAKDKITVAGQPVAAPDEARLWLYYKPEGLVTSAADEKGRETVFDRLPPELPRVMSVGRLDLNSEGLLLLTNDGELKRRLELPSTGWLRKYRVRVKGNPVDPDLEPLRKGLTVEGERFQPMIVTLDRVQGANAWLTIGLREGKNREIRRAMTAIGLTVNRLIRVSYGPFRLGDMEPGDVTEVKGRVLRDQLGMTGDEADGDRTGRAKAAPRPDRAGAERPGGARRIAKPKSPMDDRAPDARPGPAKPRRAGTASAAATKSGAAKSGPARSDAAKSSLRVERSGTTDAAAPAKRPRRTSGPTPTRNAPPGKGGPRRGG